MSSPSPVRITVTGVLGRLPTVEEYLNEAGELNNMAADIYRYLNFNEIDSYNTAANSVVPEQAFA